MINRIIEFCSRNRFIVLLIVGMTTSAYNYVWARVYPSRLRRNF